MLGLDHLSWSSPHIHDSQHTDADLHDIVLHIVIAIISHHLQLDRKDCGHPVERVSCLLVWKKTVMSKSIVCITMLPKLVSLLCYSDPALSLLNPTLAVLCSQCRKRVVDDGFESGVILQILAADDRLNLCKDALGEVEPWRIWREEIDHVAC